MNILLRCNPDAILKIKMAANIGKIQLGIYPEKSYFGPDFMLLSKSAQFAQNLLHICPTKTVFQSISGRLPKRRRKRRERIEESKNIQTSRNRTYCKRNRSLPYFHPNCRTPRHWTFTQDHRTTRPPQTCIKNIVDSYQTAAIYKPPDKCIQTYSKLLRDFLYNLSYPSRDARIEIFHAEKQISGEKISSTSS